MAKLAVEPERLVLSLEGPSTLLESSGVRPEYVFRRDEVIGILMSWTGSLRISHRSLEAPEHVSVSGEWSLVERLRSEGYPLNDVIPWSLVSRRVIAAALVLVELTLLLVLLLAGQASAGFAAVLAMPFVGLAVWRLQKSV